MDSFVDSCTCDIPNDQLHCHHIAIHFSRHHRVFLPPLTLLIQRQKISAPRGSCLGPTSIDCVFQKHLVQSEAYLRVPDRGESADHVQSVFCDLHLIRIFCHHHLETISSLKTQSGGFTTSHLIDWHNGIGKFPLDHPHTKGFHEVIKLV